MFVVFVNEPTPRDIQANFVAEASAIASTTTTARSKLLPVKILVNTNIISLNFGAYLYYCLLVVL